MQQRETEYRIRILRYAQNLKQIEMAQELGVSQQTISRLEKNPQKVPLDLLISTSKYFHVSLDYLLGLSDDIPQNLPSCAEPDAAIIDYKNLSMQNKEIAKRIIKSLLKVQDVEENEREGSGQEGIFEQAWGEA